jgi:transcriptional regulator GlxA family with amidase domain
MLQNENENDNVSENDGPAPAAAQSPDEETTVAPAEITPAVQAEAAALIAHSMDAEAPAAQPQTQPQPRAPVRPTKRIAIVTFDGFNELDTFIALGLLNRLGAEGWKAEVASPTAYITSMNGVTVQAQQPLEFANDADAVIFGSGIYTRAIADGVGAGGAVLDRLRLDPLRQLIGAQCSGALLLARLGLLADMPACTDLTTKPWLIEAGVRVEEAPFHARGPIATAGGCLASQYLAAWMMVKGAGIEAATQALLYAAPVGEKEAYVERLLAVVRPFLDDAAA